MRSRAIVSSEGSQKYTPADAYKVLRVLRRHVGRENAVRAADLAVEAGVAGRTVRAIYAAEDGASLVLGHCAGGLYVAADEAEADALTAELLSKLRSIAKRLRARRAWFRRQAEVRQLELFEEVA